MNLISWFRKRNAAFILSRGSRVFTRYGLSSKAAESRIEKLMDCLASQNCSPTFPVPGTIVERHPAFIKMLQQRGAEIAVHGYNHVNMADLEPEQAIRDLQRAVKVFDKFGIEVHGFRCPYLSCTDEIVDSLPESLFGYSSNQAIAWKPKNHENHQTSNLFQTIDQFYTPVKDHPNHSFPWMRSGLIEIPVAVPDDLQLLDGLKFSREDVTEAWLHHLEKTVQQGELFNLMFHPELSLDCMDPFSMLLHKARSYSPQVWVVPLCEISKWWLEKRWIIPIYEQKRTGWEITLSENPRVNWLGHHLDQVDQSKWDENYQRISTRKFLFRSKLKPIIGMEPSIPDAIVRRIRNLGFFVDHSIEFTSCSVRITQDQIGTDQNEQSLIDLIEKSPAPYIRIWPWPDGNRSALSVTGDLDALSILDYANRLFVRN